MTSVSVRFRLQHYLGEILIILLISISLYLIRTMTTSNFMHIFLEKSFKMYITYMIKERLIKTLVEL